MIIKTIPIHNKYRSKQLVRYILQLDEFPDQDPFESFVLMQNLHTIDPNKVHKDFLLNDRVYRKKRSDGVALYHEILSFSPKDAEHISDEKLEVLAKKYIDIRCPEAQVLGNIHREKQHIHLHLLISGNDYKSSKSLRLSRAKFKAVRLEIEEFQKTRFPELEHSIAYLGKIREKSDKKRSDQKKRSENEFQMKARLKGKEPTKKEILKQRVSEILESIKNPKEFLMALKDESDFELYEYRGKVTGIIFEGKKYRFTTFGIAKERLQKLREQYLRMKQFSNQLNKTKSIDRGL